MWCFVSEPNGTIHELILPKGSYGIDCLDMISSRINLVEKDYFGLKYTNPSTGVNTWLNLRNKLSQQLTGRAPHRIQLTVKYFVNVQELQQQISRDIFYSTIYQQLLNEDLLDKIDQHELSKVIALIAQVKYGDFNAESVPEYSKLLPSIKWSNELQKTVETEHLNLDMVTSSEAKIQFIKIFGDLPNYGMDIFHVNSVTEHPDQLILGVRHDGLRIYKDKSILSETEQENLVQFIPYDEISTVSYKGKKFTIVHGSNQDDHVHSTFLLRKNQQAINLFRTFTEFHSFYQCNSVKKSVIEKCSRTSVARILSVFSRQERGRLYLFDVVRTRRQAYDHAWSILNAPDKKRQSAFYHSDRHINRKSVYSLSKVDEAPETHSRRPQSQSFESITFTKDHKKKEGRLISADANVKQLSLEELRETVENLLENKVCQVCMDSEVSTAFCPCGHVVCCVDCATLCRECPLCRMQITYAQRVFFSND